MLIGPEPQRQHDKRLTPVTVCRAAQLPSQALGFWGTHSAGFILNMLAHTICCVCILPAGLSLTELTWQNSSKACKGWQFCWW